MLKFLMKKLKKSTISNLKKVKMGQFLAFFSIFKFERFINTELNLELYIPNLNFYEECDNKKIFALLHITFKLLNN